MTHDDATDKDIPHRFWLLVMLRALGCGDVQGFLISRPMPGHEVAAYLDRTNMSMA